MGQTPHEKTAELAIAASMDYGTKDIPTRYLWTCFERAMRNKRDDFSLTAPQLMREWDGLLEEKKAQARAHAEEEERLLVEGRRSLGLMTIVEWKQRHNLPAAWKLGDPFPPESDLYNKPVPPRHEEPVEPYRGQWDSRWYLRKNPKVKP